MRVPKFSLAGLLRGIPSAQDWGLANPVTEQGKRFETGRPVTFRFVRNTEKAQDFGAKFQQDLEPHGRYLLHNESPGDLPRGWETGIITFRSPLVLLLTLDPEQIYGPTSWKARLSAITGKKGLALSRELKRRGYDGIVTVGRYEHGGKVSADTREIVDLRGVR